ncbi:hypothetical protein F4814DRAFT_230429 [Daldinia grandis]|nr:hypothetical protein F4814DRAFT_230429 [Daldinia grandis]
MGKPQMLASCVVVRVLCDNKGRSKFTTSTRSNVLILYFICRLICRTITSTSLGVYVCTATSLLRVETLLHPCQSEFGVDFNLNWSVASIIPVAFALFSGVLRKVLAT